MMVKRFLLGSIALHILFVVCWIAIEPRSELIAERWAVTVAATVLVIGYAVLVVAFWRARKTRLNIALSINKFYLMLLFGVITLPSLYGVLWHDAPYRVVGNPYSFWIAPAWMRTYIFIGTSISVIGVLFEFWNANWGGERPAGTRWRLAPKRPATDGIT